jgi:hypothetical protein
MTFGIVILGLASRRFPWLFPHAFGKYPGDALWTMMVFFGLGMMFRLAPSARLATYALLFSFAVEFSQIYQAPWINAVRATTVGHLVLGSGFGWRDLVAYSVGAVVAFGIEYIAFHRARFLSRV